MAIAAPAPPTVLAPFDANAIGAAWATANDHRDVEALAKLWAGDVDGVLVAGVNDLRTDRQFNGTQWAKHRKAWFEKMPANPDVAHSDWKLSQVDGQSRGIALLHAVPAAGSPSASLFKEIRLFIVRRDEGVVIQREEVELASPAGEAAVPAFLYAVTRVQDDLWAPLVGYPAATTPSSWNAPVFGSEHDGAVTSISSHSTAQPVVLTKERHWLLGRQQACETIFVSIAGFAQVNVPLAIMHAWQHDPSAVADAIGASHLAADYLQLGGSCAGDWLTGNLENATLLIATPPDAAVIELAQKDLSTTPRWLAAQAAYDANHGEGLWMDKMQFGEWKNPKDKQTYLYAFITGGEWCTAFDEAIGSLWRVLDNGKKLEPVGKVAEAPAPQGGGEAWLVDLENHAGPSIFTSNDGYSLSAGGWHRIAHRAVSDFSSICPPEQNGK